MVLLLTAILLISDTPRAGVQDAILGVRVGSTAQEVSSVLRTRGSVESRPTREGGSKQVWRLDGTDFSSIALKLDAAGRVVWVTAFARPGREIPFKQLGDTSRARSASPSRVVWDVSTAAGGYRLVAQGKDGRAGTVSLLGFDKEAVE